MPNQYVNDRRRKRMEFEWQKQSAQGAGLQNVWTAKRHLHNKKLILFSFASTEIIIAMGDDIKMYYFSQMALAR